MVGHWLILSHIGHCTPQVPSQFLITPLLQCVVNGCNGWQAVGVLLCRQHANDPAALRTADIHKNLDTYLARPAQYQLMCYTQTGNPMHLALEEGEAVDVLEIDPQGMCLCRTAAGAVGFYPRADLLTEDEVYQRFIAEEDARLQAELEARKQAQDKEAEAYEAQLREKCATLRDTFAIIEYSPQY